MQLHPSRAGRRIPRVLLALLAACTALVLSFPGAPPAQALNQYCGETAVAVGENYADGSLDNGHPEGENTPSRSLDGWGGLPAVQEAKIGVLAVERVEGALEYPEKYFDALGFDFPKVAKLGFSIAGIAVQAAKTAAEAVVLDAEQQNARVDACSDTLGADMVDVIFTAMLEEELAQLDPTATGVSADGTPLPAGVRLAPTALLLLPDDGMPAWQRDAPGYADYGDHASLDLYYQDGFINAEMVGVATHVRNQIAYLEAHGIPTGSGTTWDPIRRRWVQKEGARELWGKAMAELRTGDLRAAYAGFAKAYQLAVTAQ